MSKDQREQITHTLTGMSNAQVAETAYVFAVAANYSADAGDLVSMVLRARLDPVTPWQLLHIDMYIPSEPKPGRQQRRKRAWRMHR